MPWRASPLPAATPRCRPALRTRLGAWNAPQTERAGFRPALSLAPPRRNLLLFPLQRNEQPLAPLAGAKLRRSFGASWLGAAPFQGVAVQFVDADDRLTCVSPLFDDPIDRLRLLCGVRFEGALHPGLTVPGDCERVAGEGERVLPGIVLLLAVLHGRDRLPGPFELLILGVGPEEETDRQHRQQLLHGASP